MNHTVPPHLFHYRRAFALLLVLITLALTTAIAVLFLSNVGRERRSVDLYVRGVQARHLAHTTVNLVMGQISAATKEGTAADPVSWASQPGMIRTWNTSGNLSKAYKLYSWDNLVQEGASFNSNAATELPSTTWSEQPAQYTDINEPVNGIYPIVDPTIANYSRGGVAIQTSSVNWDFPGEFAIAQDNSAYHPSANNNLPMPVKWLYILQDGSWVASTNPTGNSVTVTGATTNNPIVGRIAFWTDDESSKVNINTASEGAFWDTPKSASRDEMQFAANPPVKGEFQRTPGHPATTSISSVFPELKTAPDRWSNTSTYRTESQAIHNMLPRIEWGANGQGSQGGTYPVNSYTTDYNLSPSALAAVPGPIPLDRDRLYATGDDLWFAPDRTPNEALDARITPKAFQQRLFFLTANSRAPETTLFETPRISLWPITWPWQSSFYFQWGSLSVFRGRNWIPASAPLPTVLDPNTTALKDDPWMTAQERLIAFCGTLNPATDAAKPYFFQRQNPDSPGHDWNNITRNQEMVTYLRNQLDQPVPGFGSSLSSKWGDANTDWIALNCFDYCRSLVNQYTLESIPSRAVGPAPVLNDIGYSYTGIAGRQISINGATRSASYTEPNAFTVAPLRIPLRGTTYTTPGAYPKLDQVALVFFATDRNLPIPPQTPETPPVHTNPENDYYNPFNWRNLINPGPAYGGSGDYPVGSQTTGMKAVMLFNFSGLNPGIANYAPVFWIKIAGASFTVNGASINLPNESGRSVQWAGWLLGNPPMKSIFYPLFDKITTAPKTFSNTASSSSTWALVSDSIPIDPASVTFAFGGSRITAEIYVPYSNDLDQNPTGDPRQLVSTQQIDFSQWNTTLPIPIAPRWNVRDGVYTSSPTIADNRPNPKAASFTTPENRSINWASVEIAPNIVESGSVFSPEVLRDDLSTTGTNRPISYAYQGTSGGSSTKLSPVFENRVRGLTGRNNVNLFRAENNTVTNLFYGSTDYAFLEGIPLITPFDTVISMVIDPANPDGGDPRLPASAGVFRRIDQVLTGIQPDEVLRTTLPTTATNSIYPRATARAQYHQLGVPGAGGPMSTGYRKNQATFGSSNTPLAMAGRYVWPAAGLLGSAANPPENIVGGNWNATMHVNAAWDWTTMPGNSMDGGLRVRPDQEYQTLFVDSNETGHVQTPYFLRYGSYGAAGTNYFSPNRQVPSPVILGTLPSSLTTGWQTLAFSPNPAAGNAHPGLRNPPDHLLLDLFWMPVSEPYPISDSFSTAGKINLNYSIMPFPYIHRKTALNALLKSTWITALPESAAANYKSHYIFKQTGTRTRYPINMDNTLRAFDHKFDGGDIFRSASQVCEMFLYPGNPDNAKNSLATWDSANAGIMGWWDTQKLTGDNVREDPYNAIYSRVTTKSNTFTVHWKVQVLRKASSGNPDIWNETRDTVASELRGSTLIERYIDPNATNIPDYATISKNDAVPLSQYYKWRVVSENYFRP